MDNNAVQRIILKEDDILLIRVPYSLFQDRQAVLGLYANIKKKIQPRKNKIMILPMDVEIGVIGSKEVKEYITNVDLWQLWDENGEEVDEI